MPDLITFLTDRLDEDEQVAEAALLAFMESGHGSGARPCDGSHVGVLLNRYLPARIRAEVAAKRAILAEHGHCPCPDPDCTDCPGCSGPHYADPAPWPCPAVLALASVYADHPDYQPEWSQQ